MQAMNEETAERLRKINQKISQCKQVIGLKPETLKEELMRLRDTEDKAGKRFVTVGAEKVVGSAKLERLLRMEEIYDKLMLLKNRDPVPVLQKLLGRKLKLMQGVVKL